MTALVEDEPPKFGPSLVALYGIHDAYLVNAMRQGDSHSGYRVFFGGETHLEGFATVDAHHEIAALRLEVQAQRRALEPCVDLHAGIGEQG